MNTATTPGSTVGTSLSRESILGDDWIRDKCAKNPLRELKDDKGRPNGTYFSGPVRLSFPHLFFAQHIAGDATKPAKFSVQLNWPLCADMRPLLAGAARLICEHQKLDMKQLSPANCNLQYPSKIAGMLTPFSDQAEKPSEYSTTGAWRMSCSNTRKPGLYYPSHNGARVIIENPERKMPDGSTGEWFYGGVWAIVGFNIYINKAVPQKQIPARVNGSLLSVMFLSDDKRFGAAVADPNAIYEGMSGIDPIVVPGQSEPVADYNPAMTSGVSSEDAEWMRMMGLA